MLTERDDVMVKRRKKFRALLCLLVTAGMLLLPVDASAAGSKGMGICVSFGQSEDVRNAAPGIPIVAGDVGAVLTDTSLYEGNDLVYGVVTQGGGTYAMEYKGRLWGMALFASTAEELGDFYSDMKGPKEGGRYTMLGITADGEFEQCTVTVSRVSTEPNGDDGYDIAIEGDSSKILSPAAIVEGDTLVAIRTDSRVIAVDKPTASANGGSGGSGGGYGDSDGGSGGSDGGGSGSSTGGGTPGRKPVESGNQNNSSVLLWTVAGGAVLIAALVLLLLKKRKPEPKPELWYQPEPTEPVSSFSPPPAPRPVRLYLEIVDGPMTGQRYSVPDNGKLLLGRSMEANIRYPVDTRGVSRNHCQVFWNNGSLQVMDLGSSSGTYLRGKGQLAPNTPVPLTEGSIIYLGSKAVAVRLCTSAM